jgi:hypothetical protein
MLRICCTFIFLFLSVPWNYLARFPPVSVSSVPTHYYTEIVSESEVIQMWDVNRKQNMFNIPSDIQMERRIQYTGRISRFTLVRPRFELDSFRIWSYARVPDSLRQVKMWTLHCLLPSCLILFFFFQWLYSPCGPWPLCFGFLIYTRAVGLLERWSARRKASLPKHTTTQTQENTYTHH